MAKQKRSIPIRSIGDLISKLPDFLNYCDKSKEDRDESLKFWVENVFENNN